MGSARWSEKAAEQACRSTLDQFGINPAADMNLIRLGTNAVFKVQHSDESAIIRVSPPDYDEQLLGDQINLTNWLTARGFPTSRPLSDSIITSDNLMVTAWQFITGEPSPSDVYGDLGSLLRTFHNLTNSYDGHLPEWEPLGRLGERLSTVDTDDCFTDDDRKVLCEWRDSLTNQVSAMNFELEKGPIHGDVHTGNVIADSGTVYLVDFDRIARGPREWELTQPLVAARFFSVNKDSIDAFMEGYGWDLRESNFAETLVQLRALFMTSWLLTLPRKPSVQDEIRTRMHYWNNPSSVEKWNAV